MKIVVLDGWAANPGDLSWAPLEALGDCTVHDRTPPALTVTRASGAGVVLTNKTRMPAEVIEQLPDLRYIGVLATGFDTVDAATAAGRGVTVCNVPAYSTDSVAEMVFAHLLHLSLHAGDHAAGVRDGEWCKSQDFCCPQFPLLELAGMTMGLVGFGRIGRAVAAIAQAMRMIVIVHTPHPPSDADGIEFVGMDDVFRRADVVSLHCPLTDATRCLVNAERLAMMKSFAFLINTSRGGAVDEAALAEALNAGRIAGAGLDVLSAEPPPETNPLLAARNCVITPHIAWATRQARQRLLDIAIENVRAFLAGSPRNVVS